MRRPNILWVMTDEQRADSIACDGAPWAVSPRLDELAASGCRLTAAYTPSPVCVSARVSLLTGRAPSATGVLNNHHQLDPARARWLTASFEAAGYQTATFGKLHVNCPEALPFQTRGGGTTDAAVRPFGYTDPTSPEAGASLTYPNPERPWLLAGRFPGRLEETREALNVEEALAWLAARDRQRPFLLRVSQNAPHTPAVAPAPYDTMIDPAAIDLPIDGAWSPAWPPLVGEYFGQMAGTHRLSAEELARARQCYYGRCAMVDTITGRLLDGAADLGALDGTIVVFCSDHGSHLGDHGFLQKQSWYEESARVPLLLAGEGVAAGQRVARPVNLACLLPTLLELAGLPVPAPTEYPSLAAAVTGGEAPDEPVIGEIDYGIWGYRDGDRYAMVRSGDWKLALYQNPGAARPSEPEHLMLHNLADDPSERRNLAAEPAHAATVSALRAALAAWDERVAAAEENRA